MPFFLVLLNLASSFLWFCSFIIKLVHIMMNEHACARSNVRASRTMTLKLQIHCNMGNACCLTLHSHTCLKILQLLPPLSCIRPWHLARRKCLKCIQCFNVPANHNFEKKKKKVVKHLDGYASSFFEVSVISCGAEDRDWISLSLQKHRLNYLSLRFWFAWKMQDLFPTWTL